MWCLDRIVNSDNRCPNCRNSYNPDHYRIVNVPETYCYRENVKTREDEDDDGDDSSVNRNNIGQTRKGSDHTLSCEDSEFIQTLRTTRIVQRNLVYLVGMPSDEVDEAVLKSDKMFGRYGELQKVVKNSNTVPGGHMSSVGL